ncbi:MAG TPA: hypothetical protein VFQ25_12655 [Ktedonobacterales bacterium]|nr:hypothetical protein [Ktedonobacterales bacterium]
MGFTASTGEMETTGILLESWDDLTTARVWREILTHPLAVTLTVVIVYGASLWLSFGVQNQNPRALATVGTLFINKGGAASPIIEQDIELSQPASRYGYAGQFNYFIALDPLNAAPYIDDPALRYGRILYPMAARALALDNPALIPYTLVYVNALAMLAGTLAVALWLRRRRMAPWIALVYGLFPGLFFAFRHDLSEPLAFALVAWGVLALGWSRPYMRFVAASALFALAALTCEVTFIISVPYIVRLAWPEITAQDWVTRYFGIARSGLVLIGSVGPFLIWKTVLYAIFGVVILDPQQYLPFSAPFAGLLWHWSQITQPRVENQVYFIAIPGAIAAVAAILILLRWPVGWRPSTIALAINALYMCVFLAPQSFYDYGSSGRIQSGIVLAAILALPVFDALWRQSRGWFWAASALWLMPLWLFGIQPMLQSYLQYFQHISG